jgi:hypothetical protein
MPFNTTAKHVMLDALDESVTQITHVGVHQLTDPGTGTNATGTEATGGSPAYARQAVTWGAAAAEVKQNTNAITIDLPAGTYGFITFWNANTGNTNNYRGYAPINGTVRGFFSVDTTLTNDQFLSPGHGLSDGDRVLLFNVLGTALPTGVSEGTVYFVVNSAANTFKVSTTSGGAAVDLTAVGGGEGYFEKIIPETFGAQGQLTIAASALTLDLTGV